MEHLKELFYQHYANGSTTYDALGEMPEVKAANKNAASLLKRIDSGEAFTGNSVEEVITESAAANEMQGWVYGYMYAMTLMAECGIKVGVVNE